MRILTFVLLCAAFGWTQANPQATASVSSANNPSATAERHDAGKLTVPVGTKIPLSLVQAISTKNARQGDPVYASTSFPVAIGGRLLIPAGTYVQGVIDRVHRPGRVKGKAEILIHFTSLVFPNGYTVVTPAGVENVPGAEQERVKDQEGTILLGGGNKGEKVKTAAGTAATGAVIGAASSGTGKGALIGGGIGGAAGLAIAMLSRGPDVRLLPGTSIEMVIQRPLALDASRVHAPAE